MWVGFGRVCRLVHDDGESDRSRGSLPIEKLVRDGISSIGTPCRQCSFADACCNSGDAAGSWVSLPARANSEEAQRKVSMFCVSRKKSLRRARLREASESQLVVERRRFTQEETKAR